MATILLVEDERGISDIVRAYLEKENYTVLQALTAKKRCNFSDPNRLTPLFWI